MQYKSLICELIEVANRLASGDRGCVLAIIMADGRACKDCNCDDCRIDVARYILDLAYRLALAHKAELKTLKKRLPDMFGDNCFTPKTNFERGEYLDEVMARELPCDGCDAS